MKMIEVNKRIIGRCCKCIFMGLLVMGVIEDIIEDKYMVSVKVCFDMLCQWGDEFYFYDWFFGWKVDGFGFLKYLELLFDKMIFDVMIVIFGEFIGILDVIFEDVKIWGVCFLKGWIDSYESICFIFIGIDKVVIISEYNMECVKEWLEYNMFIKNIIIG